jgi:DNA-binding transcriptional LysR family regulator
MTEGWVGLELRHLVALQAIADQGSFKAAARLLGYTPSAISQQIAGLERVVGTQLIAREHGKQALGLTEAGRVLLGHMAAIESRLRAAKADIEALNEGTVGVLRVGAFESVGARLLPELLGRFSERFPRLRVEVDEAVTDLGHMRSLEQGALDVAFTMLPLPPGPFETRRVWLDPWVLVVRAESEYTELAGTVVDLHALGELPLACFRSARSVDAVLARMRAAGIEPRIVLRSDYNDALQEFAATGRGVALMPLMAVNLRDQRTAVVELGGLIPPREIGAAWPSDRLPNVALETFVSLAVEIGSTPQDREDRLASAWSGPNRPRPIPPRPTPPKSGPPSSNPLRASAVVFHGRPL